MAYVLENGAWTLRIFREGADTLRCQPKDSSAVGRPTGPFMLAFTAAWSHKVSASEGRRNLCCILWIQPSCQHLLLRSNHRGAWDTPWSYGKWCFNPLQFFDQRSGVLFLWILEGQRGLSKQPTSQADRYIYMIYNWFIYIYIYIHITLSGVHNQPWKCNEYIPSLKLTVRPWK